MFVTKFLFGLKCTICWELRYMVFYSSGRTFFARQFAFQFMSSIIATGKKRYFIKTSIFLTLDKASSLIYRVFDKMIVNLILNLIIKIEELILW